MLKVIAVALAPCVALCVAAADETAVVAPNRDAEPRLELRLRALTPKLKRDESARWEVTVVNRGKHDAWLVKPGDGSDCGWRTPIIEWVINGEVDGQLPELIRTRKVLKAGETAAPAEKPELKPACLGDHFAHGARCGNINGLKANEVVTLKPGEQVKFDEWTSGPRFSFEKTTHKVSVRYFHIPDLKWRGILLKSHDTNAMEQLRRIPHITLESNTIEIRVQE